jgi:hypothetical protein
MKRIMEEHGIDPTRKAQRLKALLALGATLENGGSSVHLRGSRMDVRAIAEMNETVWSGILDWISRGRRNTPAQAPILRHA